MDGLRPTPRRRSRRDRGRPGPRNAHSRRDRRGRPDDVRPVHGARPVPPQARLLPERRRTPRARGRLPDRAGGPPDLRPGDRPPRRRRLVGPRPAGAASSIREYGAGSGALASRAGRRPPGGGGRRSRRSSATGPSRSSRGATRGARRPSRRPRRTGRRSRPIIGLVARQRSPRRAADAPGRRHERRPPRGLRRHQSTAASPTSSGRPRPTPSRSTSTPTASASPTASGRRSASRRTPGWRPPRRAWRGGSSCSSTTVIRPRRSTTGVGARTARSPRTSATRSTTTRTGRSAGRT